MKLISYNYNFGKLGPHLLKEILIKDVDVVCLQRFDILHLDQFDLSKFDVHFTTSFSKQPLFEKYGLLCLSKASLGGRFRDHHFQNYFMAGDRFQGNSAAIIEFDDHAVINSLTCYPSDGLHQFWLENDQQLYEGQLQETFDLANSMRCVLTGDFHYEICEPVWRRIATNGYKNHAERIAGYRNPQGRCMSLTMVWSRDIPIVKTDLAINPIGRPEAERTGGHWSVSAEYQP
jgi:mRNA deadenylase 3'-5' endonuclease subunit Ccr4